MTRTYAQDLARGVRYVSEPGTPVNLGKLGICATVKVSVYHAPAAKAPPKPVQIAVPAKQIEPCCGVCGAVNPTACRYARCPIACRPQFHALEQARA